MIETGNPRSTIFQVIEAHLQQCATMTSWSGGKCGTKQFRVHVNAVTVSQHPRNGGKEKTDIGRHRVDNCTTDAKAWIFTHGH